MYFGFGYGLYFYFTWLPTYLIRELGFTVMSGGFFAALPFLLAGIANLAGGWLTDSLARTHGLRVARCWLGCSAFLTCAALVYASTAAGSPVAKALLLASRSGDRPISPWARAGRCHSTSAPSMPASSPAS